MRNSVTALHRLPVADRPEALPLARRRAIFLALNAATVAALLAGMLWMLHFNGIVLTEWIMLALFAVSLPWLSIGTWNALIGLMLTLRLGDDAAAHVTPQAARPGPADEITARTAIVMALRNEAAERAIGRIERLQRDLSATPWAGQFDYHVLSDTDSPLIAAQEEAAVGRWRARAPGLRIHYRRREDNTGYKAGNIGEFAERCRDDYDFFLPLDADSVMGGAAVLRLVRVMQASPELGMLQGLVVGTPATSFFTRAFQYGMRHGMRSYTLGSAWWQGDCGPCWGHNLLIRLRPFADHCRLPVLRRGGALAGHILSHDQVEAVLMRRAGYEVRVLAEEDESFEDNPPSLPDFIRRELRWCHGNMQYLHPAVIAMPGLKPLSRVQLALAVAMYAGAPAWIAFITLGAGLAGFGEQLSGVPVAWGLAFFALLMTLNLLPKLMGVAQVALTPGAAARYGGHGRLFAGAGIELVFSFLMAPAVALALTIGVIGLILGRRVNWKAQQRDPHRLTAAEAARTLWPQTLAGLSLAGWLAATAPWALPFAAPVLASLAFAIPFAALTTAPGLGAWSRRTGLFDIPEERSPRPAVQNSRVA